MNFYAQIFTWFLFNLVILLNCVFFFFFKHFLDGPVTDMCPPKTDETNTENIHAGAEIEVKPPENCLTHALQVIFIYY